MGEGSGRRAISRIFRWSSYRSMQERRQMFSGSIPGAGDPFSRRRARRGGVSPPVDWQIENGSAALVPCGTTGEASTLSNAEHHRVIEICVEQAAGRVPVIAGCGSNDTKNALLHIKFAQEAGVTRGCGCALLQPPEPGRADRAFQPSGRECATCRSCSTMCRAAR